MAELFVKPQYLKMLTDIFDEYCPHADVWAYGSRINGRAHDGSDLDLVVKNFNGDKISIGELKEIFVESDIPFLIDIHEFDAMPDFMQTEILKNYVVIR